MGSVSDLTAVFLGTAVTAAMVAWWPRPTGHPDRSLTTLLGTSDLPSTDDDSSTPSGRQRFRRGPRIRRARTPTSDEIASAMVLLAVALQSGCGVVEAIEEVARICKTPAGQDLAVVAAALRWGVDDAQAWSVVGASWSRTALALRLAAAAGAPPSGLLLSGAEDLRSQERAAVDRAAARVGVRLVLPLGLTFLPAFVLSTIVPVVLALSRQVLQP